MTSKVSKKKSKSKRKKNPILLNKSKKLPIPLIKKIITFTKILVSTKKPKRNSFNNPKPLKLRLINSENKSAKSIVKSMKFNPKPSNRNTGLKKNSLNWLLRKKKLWEIPIRLQLRRKKWLRISTSWNSHWNSFLSWKNLKNKKTKSMLNSKFSETNKKPSKPKFKLKKMKFKS